MINVHIKDQRFRVEWEEETIIYTLERVQRIQIGNGDCIHLSYDLYFCPYLLRSIHIESNFIVFNDPSAYLYSSRAHISTFKRNGKTILRALIRK